MSVVKVQGNPSGTGAFTIAAPATNTDRTLTLPDQTGTVLTNAGPFTANASASNGAVTVDASNNVGIGTSSPATKLQIVGGNTDDAIGTVQAVYTGTAQTVNTSFTVKNYSGTSQFMQWDVFGLRFGSRIKTNSGQGNVVFTYGNDSEGMRLDSSGNLLVNTTTRIGSWARFSVVGVEAEAASFKAGGNNYIVAFYPTGSSTQVGTISTNGSTTSYNTSSDYRLKEDVQPLSGALAKVAALKPVTYRWKETGIEDQGFIAHELAEVCPQAVTGEKDAVDAEGNPVYQGIDTSFLVATLTAAIQEQQVMIEDLKARVAALEAK